MIERGDTGGSSDDGPVCIEGEKGERHGDVKVRFNAAASRMNQQR